MRLPWFLIVAIIAGGCSKPAPSKTKTVMNAADVPPGVLKAAETKEPQVKFNKVIKTPDGIYEVQGKNAKGKIVEVEVSEDGKVLKVE